MILHLYCNVEFIFKNSNLIKTITYINQISVYHPCIKSKGLLSYSAKNPWKVKMFVFSGMQLVNLKQWPAKGQGFTEKVIIRQY